MDKLLTPRNMSKFASEPTHSRVSSMAITTSEKREIPVEK
jgi:hypothetical protein